MFVCFKKRRVLACYLEARRNSVLVWIVRILCCIKFWVFILSIYSEYWVLSIYSEYIFWVLSIEYLFEYFEYLFEHLFWVEYLVEYLFWALRSEYLFEYLFEVLSIYSELSWVFILSIEDRVFIWVFVRNIEHWVFICLQYQVFILLYIENLLSNAYLCWIMHWIVAKYLCPYWLLHYFEYWFLCSIAARNILLYGCWLACLFVCVSVCMTNLVSSVCMSVFRNCSVFVEWVSLHWTGTLL